MGQAKSMMMEFEESERNEYQDLKDEKLFDKLKEVNGEIEEYKDELNSQVDNLLSDDEDDEFDKDCFEEAVKEILDRVKGKQDLLDSISRYNELKEKLNI